MNSPASSPGAVMISEMISRARGVFMSIAIDRLPLVEPRPEQALAVLRHRPSGPRRDPPSSRSKRITSAPICRQRHPPPAAPRQRPSPRPPACLKERPSVPPRFRCHSKIPVRRRGPELHHPATGFPLALHPQVMIVKHSGVHAAEPEPLGCLARVPRGRVDEQHRLHRPVRHEGGIFLHLARVKAGRNGCGARCTWLPKNGKAAPSFTGTGSSKSGASISGTRFGGAYSSGMCR